MRRFSYDTIDIDFMNETSLLMAVVNMVILLQEWESKEKLLSDTGQIKMFQERLASWMRTAVGIMEGSHIRVCRSRWYNMKRSCWQKVINEAQIKFGWEVDAYPVNEIADYVKDVAKGSVDALVDEYYSNKYSILLEEIRKNLNVM